MNATDQTNTPEMQAAIINLIAKVGLDAALAIMKAIASAPTLSDAVSALEGVKTAEQYVAEDALRRGIPALPLPSAQ